MCCSPSVLQRLSLRTTRDANMKLKWSHSWWPATNKSIVVIATGSDIGPMPNSCLIFCHVRSTCELKTYDQCSHYKEAKFTLQFIVLLFRFMIPFLGASEVDKVMMSQFDDYDRFQQKSHQLHSGQCSSNISRYSSKCNTCETLTSIES